MKRTNGEVSGFALKHIVVKHCCMGMFLLMPACLWAQESGDDLFEMSLEQLAQVEVTIATGSAQSLKSAPAIATVITAEDIKAMGATELDQVLESVPGLHVSRSANQLSAVYSIRGNHNATNSQILMLLNGVPVKDIYTGGTPRRFRMPVANISRVEVIRGPGSALYGADAFAGVINVITKNSDELAKAAIGARTGSFSSREAWVQHGGLWGDWKVAFSTALSRSDGDRGRIVDADLQTILDRNLGTTATRAPGALDTRYNVRDTHLELSRGEWNVKLWNWDNSGGVGPGVAQALDPEGRQDITRYNLDIGYQNPQWTEQWGLDARLGYGYMNSQLHFVILPAGAVVPIGADGNVNPTAPVGLVSFPSGLIGDPGMLQRDLTLAVTASYSGWQDQRLRIGVGGQHSGLETNEAKNFGPGVIDGTVSPIGGRLTDVTNTPNVYTPEKRRTLKYVLVQDEWQMNTDWALTVGLRHDQYSDFGSTTNPRLALVWATNDKLTSKLLYGQAFRAPTFVELYVSNNPAFLGNSNIQPETIKTLELGFDYRPADNTRTALNLFSYATKNNIEFKADPAPLTTVSAQNTEGQRGHGFELEGEWRPSPVVQLRANYAWQNSKRKDTGQRVEDAPGKHAFVNARWNFLANWTAAAQANWIADRKRAVGDTRSAIADYTTVDLTLRRRHLAKDLELAASVRNAFKANAREPSNGTIPGDYPLEGRSFYVELKYELDTAARQP